MTFDGAKVAAGPSLCSGTGSSDTSGEGREKIRLSEEQPDLLDEKFKSHPDPGAEQTRELVGKLTLMTELVELLFGSFDFHRKERLHNRTKVDALALDAAFISQGIVTPELRLRIQEYRELGLLHDKLKENEQLMTESSHIPGLSKEQLDLLLEAFDRSPIPLAEQTSELGEKLKLTTGQVELWFRKERLYLPKKMEATTLEVGCLLQGIVTPEVQRRIEQDEKLRLLRDKSKALGQELELKLDNLIKLPQDKAKVPEQENQQVTKTIAGMQNKSKVLEQENEQQTKLIAEQTVKIAELTAKLAELKGRLENIVGAIQLPPAPTTGPDRDTGTPSDQIRKRASENTSERGKKNVRRE